ncbi:MAG: hypothetical protein WCG98_07950 [bacterium]
MLDKKKKAKEAEYQENRAIVDIYNKLSQPEFESGKLNLGALAGKETAEGVACITKALVQFISDKYEGNIE